jgi:signal transduction histidine kinase/CheY-like chemotaxis protein
MPTPSLKEFAQAIPVCEQTSSLSALLEIFQASGCDAIVVVSEQQRPLGVVNLRQVLPHLLSSARLGETPVAIGAGDFHKPLSHLEPTIIEPLAIVPDKLSLSQFWVYLKESGNSLRKDWGSFEEGESLRAGEWESGRIGENSPITLTRYAQAPQTPHHPCIAPTKLKIENSLVQHWALVDGDGKFLGLLNSWLLLKSLTPNFTTSEASTGTDEEPQPTSIKLLVQLLEQLPLPLSLQTATGQVLTQNLSWRQQIGTSPDFEWIRRTTAAMLDSPCVEPQTTLKSSTVPESHTLKKRTTLKSSTSRSPFAGNAINPLNQTCVQALAERHCAIATPHMAAAVSKRREILSTSPVLKTQENPASWEESVPGGETQEKSQERVFSFVKIPLSLSVVESKRIGKQKKQQGFSPDACGHGYGSDLCLVMAQDTTEQQQVAKELAAKNADLVQLNRLKDEFLACISHELKTPLTAVLGLSSLLKDQALGKLNERQARYARLIYQSGRQLMTVVNDILDLTRMETGQLELTLEPVQIQNVCDRAYSQAQQLQSDKDPNNTESTPDTQFTLEIEPGLEKLVADELRLRQMLGHLLSNALKFTDAGGEIGLKINRWDGWIAFTVWDTGIGIPPEKQHLIFQKFQQLEEPLTRRFEGTGLGLVLTQRLARLHGGDVSFISKSGEGSEFTLLLPSCPPQGSWGEQKQQSGGEKENHLCHPAPLPRISEQQATRNRLVLIVETVPRYLEGLTEQLNRLGYRVVIARSGTEAIEKARSLQPCVVLLNPLLPQLSGWDVLTLLKSDNQTLHIPVLVTATQAEKQQAYHHKADGFLSLPVQEQALVQSLTRLGQHQELTKPRSLTILHLNPELEKKPSDLSLLSSDFTDILSLQHSELNYRVIEADDLEQAELLARIWHPDVVLLDSAKIADPLAYLQQLSLHSDLTSLPLVTLDHQTTEAANQVMGLSVYPCLAEDNSSKIAALLQVIQVAAGMSRQPNILVMDLSVIQQEPELSKPERRMPNKTQQQKIRRRNSSNSSPVTANSSWLQAVIQYLQTAGCRSLASCSLTEVYRQLQEQSIDLMLIRLKDINDSSTLMKRLMSLAQQPNLPPILVLDHRLETEPLDDTFTSGSDSTSELDSQLKAIATQILRGPSQSMPQLLEQINQILADQ